MSSEWTHKDIQTKIPRIDEFFIWQRILQLSLRLWTLKQRDYFRLSHCVQSNHTLPKGRERSKVKSER